MLLGKKKIKNKKEMIWGRARNPGFVCLPHEDRVLSLSNSHRVSPSRPLTQNRSSPTFNLSVPQSFLTSVIAFNELAFLNLSHFSRPQTQRRNRKEIQRENKVMLTFGCDSTVAASLQWALFVRFQSSPPLIATRFIPLVFIVSIIFRLGFFFWWSPPRFFSLIFFRR